MQRYTRVVSLLVVLAIAAAVHAQTATYHLHKEASTVNTSFDKLLTAGPDVTSVALTTVLTSKAVGEYVVKEFETQTGVPNTVGVIPSGSTLSFSLWMRKTANFGTVFPRAKIRLNNATGTLFCTATGATALTTTVTKQTFTCTSAANITMTASDRFYLWVGVNLTVTSSSTFSGEVDLEGTLNGNFDSQITLPLGTGLPTVTNLTPTSGAFGSSIVIAGTNFRASQVTGSTVKFGGTQATTITNWSTTSITATVPTGAPSGLVAVTVGGQVNTTGPTFTVTSAPSITSIAPTTGAVGSSVVIAGANFNAQGTGSAVKFGTIPATSFTNWTTSSVTAVVPAGANGAVVVTAAGGVSSTGGPTFTLTSVPSVSSVTSNSGAVNSSVTIAGTNFNAQGTGSAVSFNGTPATSITNWTTNSITAIVPGTATTGPVAVTAAGGVSSTTGPTFTVTPPPNITLLTPSTGEPGTPIAIAGNNFTGTTGTVTFGGQTASTTGWTNTSITATVPNGATNGNVVVTAGGLQSNGSAFTVLAPILSGLNPTSGAAGTVVTISGSNLGGSTGTVTFGGQTAAINSWADGAIQAVVPGSAPTGNVVVSHGGLQSNGIAFTVAEQVFSGPVSYSYDGLGRLISAVASSGDAVRYSYDAVGNILSITRYAAGQSATFEFHPKSGPVGASVTISGSNFSTDPAQDTVKFNGTTASISSASATTLVVTVPAGATTGTLSITSPGGSVASADSFTVLTSPGTLTISSFTPQIVAAAGSTVLTGTNFDSVAQNDELILNVTPTAVPTSVTSTNLTMAVPLLAGSGRISLRTPAGIAVSSGDLFVPPATFTPAQVAYTGRANFGTATNVSIPTANKTGLLLFDGQSGHNASVSVSSPSFNSCSYQIYKPDNTPLSSTTASCTSASFLDSQQLPITGTYAVFINASAGSAGSGVFTINDSTDVTGSILVSGPAVTVTTTVPGQNARLTFFGNQKQHVSITLSSNTFTSCSVHIFDANILVVAAADCGSSTTFIDVPYLPERGIYTIAIDPGSTQTGTITVKLNDATDLTGTMTPGGAQVTPNISVPGQNALYTFSGVQNQHVSLSILNTAFNCSISLTNPDGSTMLFGNGSNLSFLAHCNASSGFVDVPLLTQTGTYKMFVDPAGAATGTATLRLNDVSDITGAITTDGTPVTITTTVPGQKVKLTFNGTAGQMVTALQDINTYTQNGVSMELVTPSGSTIATGGGDAKTPQFIDDAQNCNNGSSSYLCGNITLPSTGTYTLLFTPASGGTGQLRVQLYSVSDVTGVGTLGGPQIPITIATPGQNARITFPGAQGGRYSIAFTGASFTANAVLNPFGPGFAFQVMKPDGTLFDGQYFYRVTDSPGFIDNGESVTFPTTGTYTMILNPAADAAGPINVNLYDATDLNLNINADGSANAVTTTSPGQNIHLNFTPTIGQSVSALVTNITYPGPQPNLILRRVDAGGSLSNVQFSSVDGSNRFLDAIPITQAGSYFLFVDPPGQSVGSETVTLYTINDINTTVDTLNHAVTVTTTVPGQNANITFSANSGQTLTWFVSNSSFAINRCSATLKAPNGSVLYQRDCNGGGLWSDTRTAPQTGTYTIVMDPVLSLTGSLTVSVTAQ